MKHNKLFALSALVALTFGSCNDDDDSQPFAPGVSITINQNTIDEGVGTVTLNFNTTDVFDKEVTLTYAVSGTAVADEDYNALAGNITLGAGQSTVTQDLIIIDDDQVEETEDLNITLTGVDGGTDFIATANTVTLSITDNDSFAYENGILVLHEGNFLGGNASVSFVTPDLSTATNGIFNAVNDKALGDTAQSMGFNGDLAYVVVNNSQTVEVVNRYTFKAVGTVSTGLLNPRYITFADGKGYVTNWGDGSDATDDFVAVIDLETNTVTGTIAVPEGPEWIVAKDNTLYVAHQGGFSQNNVVSVIDASTNTITASITVADRPNSMQLIADTLWVLSGGNPAWTGNETAGQLDKIDTTTNTVSDRFSFAETEHPGFLSADDDVLYYLMEGNVYAMPTTATALPEMPVISGVSFYDMTANDGKLYGVDAKDFKSDGALTVYDLTDNTQAGTITVGIVPGGIYFNDDFEF